MGRIIYLKRAYGRSWQQHKRRQFHKYHNGVKCNVLTRMYGTHIEALTQSRLSLSANVVPTTKETLNEEYLANLVNLSKFNNRANNLGYEFSNLMCVYECSVCVREMSS